MGVEMLLILDVDGVLIDSRERYLQSVADTATSFLPPGCEPFTLADVDEMRRKGGNNDDIICIQSLLAPVVTSVPTITELLSVYLKMADERWYLEKWLACPGLLENMGHLGHALALFTSRPRKELYASLGWFREQCRASFASIVTMEDVTKGKPDPEGLFKTVAAVKVSYPNMRRVAYVGDAVDDADAAKAADINFVGIAPAGSKDAELLQAHGASRVVPSINALLGRVTW